MNRPKIQKIRPLAGGGGGASIDLVTVDGEMRVLKRQSPRHAMAERLFQQALRQAGLPNLRTFDHPDLGPDQVLLEYVDGSATVGRALSLQSIERYGTAIGRLHSVKSPRFVELNGEGHVIEANWPAFLKRAVATGVARQRQTSGGLETSLLDRVEAVLASLEVFEPECFALAHGDLHLNNALVRGDEVVLFDKAPDVWVAPPVFDLAVIYSEAFPGVRYVASEVRKSDRERHAAFLSGYGPMLERDMAWLDHFVLVRSLRRYPNPFVPDLLTTIVAALSRCEAGDG